MTLIWSLERDAQPEDLAVLADGVFTHIRDQLADGDAAPIACLVREGTRVVAGGSGRTECQRLFIHNLWVAPEHRGQGIARKVLAELESEAVHRGCRDALIETLDDSVASLYFRLGYQPLVVVERYLGRFNRHIMLKPCLSNSR
ncbi:MAG: GNAT family N-acetyltransferase [Synechococcaceae cyanobacterium]